ncbi:hypothetical protein [Corynebacterium pyruviciproducens]|uniref:Uncharacterized protein n=1 Tax=Corynebacterium pyruviciproducens TaxID=598660 RepID=A0AAF1BTQ3_9CORY|nr:hypothetical protein [Corynebacterium pyruviciproducens]WOT03409.1 hypothetical protein CYJ47_06555 [Corynebacterium pyruviciproducens]
MLVNYEDAPELVQQRLFPTPEETYFPPISVERGPVEWAQVHTPDYDMVSFATTYENKLITADFVYFTSVGYLTCELTPDITYEGVFRDLKSFNSKFEDLCKEIDNRRNYK